MRLDLYFAGPLRLAAFRLAALALLSALPLAGVAATPAMAVFTIVEGDVVVVREALKFRAVEGLQVQADDIVQTADNARLARLELAGGGALDLGPATRLLLQPRFADTGMGRPTQLYLAQGWLKLTAASLGVGSPQLDLADMAGAAIVRVTNEASFVFVESGRARLVQHQEGRALQELRLKEGQAYAHRAGEAASVTARPAPELLKSMPRAFADTLPLRAARFRDSAVAPASPADITYPEVATWINAERSLRPGFVQRWRAKTRDPQFRPALIAELRAHPEWHRALFPEKYLPKPRPVAAVQAAVAPQPAPLSKLTQAPPPAVAAVTPVRISTEVERSAATSAPVSVRAAAQ